MIPDSPAITRALWISNDERKIAQDRMKIHGTNTARLIDRRRLVAKIRSTAASPVSWLFLAAYLQFAWSQRANSYFLLYLKVSHLSLLYITRILSILANTIIQQGLKNSHGEQ